MIKRILFFALCLIGLPAVMADPAPVTEETFVADRAEFFHRFTKFVLYNAIVIVVILALLGIFLG